MRRLRRWDPERALLALAQTRARRRGVDFQITIDDIVIPDRCPVLGIKLAPGTKRSLDNAPSIDRLDPRRGYVPGNIHVISHRANRLKGDGTPEEHEAIAAWQRKEAP